MGTFATFEAMLNRNAYELIGTLTQVLRELDEYREEGTPSLRAAYSAELGAAEDYPETVRISYRYAREHAARSFGISLEESPEEGEERIVAQLPAIKARAEAERKAAGEEKR